MTPQMGVYTKADADADIAAHAAVPSAHHPQEVVEGRGYYGTTSLIGVPGVRFASVGTLTATYNRIFYISFMVTTPITVNQVIIEVTTPAAAGKKCRIGIYAADKNWQPLARKVASAQIAIDTAAVVTTDVTATVLTPGRYLIAFTGEATAIFRSARGADKYIQLDPVFGASAIVTDIFVAATYAALPDPGTAWDYAECATPPWHYFVLLQWTPGSGG